MTGGGRVCGVAGARWYLLAGSPSSTIPGFTLMVSGAWLVFTQNKIPYLTDFFCENSVVWKLTIIFQLTINYSNVFRCLLYGLTGLLSHLPKLLPNTDIFFLYSTFNNMSFSTKFTVESFAHLFPMLLPKRKGRNKGKVFVIVSL